MRYFIYCRKSTDSEERQILSLASQESELKRAFAARPDISIVEVLEESVSAKQPGRPVFDLMLSRIENGEAAGILCWHPDRLARNAIDGGRIIHMLDRGKLLDLKFSTFTFENNSQGKFMLSIMFGYSKYYVDTLSENVKRGNRAKVERGWRPGLTPLGYRNDRETRTIVADPEHFDAVRRMLRLVLAEQQSVRSILRIVTEDWGYRTPHYGRYCGKPLAQATFYALLANPFYAGYFRWNGQLYLGKHSPMITLDEHRQIQRYIGRPGTAKPQRHAFPFTGLMRCGACGLMVTAEHKINRFGSRYIYYHCTKRNAHERCRQPSIEGAALHQAFASFLLRLVLDDEVTLRLAERVKEDTDAKQLDTCRPIRDELLSFRAQLETADDLRLRNVWDDTTYVRRRRELSEAILAAEDRLERAGRAKASFEPALLLISFLNQATNWFQAGSDEVRRAIVRTVGSNYKLLDQKLLAEASEPFVLKVKEPEFLYMSSFIEHVRTRFVNQDPAFLTLLDQVRKIRTMVEAEGHRVAPLPSVPGERRSRRGLTAEASGSSLQ